MYQLLMHGFDNQGNPTDDCESEPIDLEQNSHHFKAADYQGCWRCESSSAHVTPMGSWREVECEYGYIHSYAVAKCCMCKKPIGTIKHSPSTLFGYEEDSRVGRSFPKKF